MFESRNKKALLFGMFFLLLLNACGNSSSQNKANPVGNNLPAESENEEKSPYEGNSVEVNSTEEQTAVENPSFEESANFCVSENLGVKYGYMYDPRDSRIYNTITIGCQTWMAENLNIDLSQLNFPPYSWYNAEHMCNPDNCSEFGRYYTQSSAMMACPEGWLLPTNAEWETLLKNLGSDPFAMQSVGYEGWPYATNASFFSAIPSGFYDNINLTPGTTTGGFRGVGSNAVFWSATHKMGDFYYNLSIDGNSVNFGESFHRNYNSVRCVMKTPDNLMNDPRNGKFYKIVTIGSQTWMAENLNYAMPDSYCNYDSCKVFGRYYTRNAAMEACPEGWHLPNNDEWETLYQYLDGHYDALLLEGYIVISKTLGFTVMPYPTYPSEASGFSALLAGNCNYGHCDNSDIAPYATFWSATENYYWAIDVNGASIYSPSYSSDALSVRCLMDSP